MSSWPGATQPPGGRAAAAAAAAGTGAGTGAAVHLLDSEEGLPGGRGGMVGAGAGAGPRGRTLQTHPLAGVPPSLRAARALAPAPPAGGAYGYGWAQGQEGGGALAGGGWQAGGGGPGHTLPPDPDSELEDY